MILASATTTTSPGLVISSIVLVIVAIAVYWVPSIVAARRKVPNVGTIAVINLFLGWTVIGWVVALAMAMRDRPHVMNGA